MGLGRSRPLQEERPSVVKTTEKGDTMDLTKVRSTESVMARLSWPEDVVEKTPEMEVFYNDKLLNKIIGYVNDPRDRKALELTNIRMLVATRLTKWDRVGSHLKFHYIHDRFTISLGNIHFRRDMLTQRIRKKNTTSDVYDTQNEHFLVGLKSFLHRFHENIVEFSILAPDQYLKYLGDHERIVMTRDLLMLLDSYLQKVRYVTLDGVIIDRHTVAYIPTCTLFSRIDYLSLENLTIDRYAVPALFGEIVSTNLKMYKQVNMPVRPFGMVLADILVNKLHRINTITCKVTDYTGLEPDDLVRMLNDLYSSCNHLRLFGVRTEENFRSISRAFCRFFDYTNLTEINLNIFDKNDEVVDQLAAALQFMNKMETITIDGCCDYFHKFQHCLKKNYRLRKIVMKGVDEPKPYVMTNFIKSLPKSLKTLELRNERPTCVGLHDEHWPLLTKKLKLETLIVHPIRSTSEEGAKKFILNCPSLRFIHIYLPFNTLVGKTFLRRRDMPRIEFLCKALQAPALNKLLKSFFHYVEYESVIQGTLYTLSGCKTDHPTGPAFLKLIDAVNNEHADLVNRKAYCSYFR